MFFPAESRLTHWLRITNVLPPDVIVSPKALVVDERSLWTQGLFTRWPFPGGTFRYFPPESFTDMFLSKDGKRSVSPSGEAFVCLSKGARLGCSPKRCLPRLLQT